MPLVLALLLLCACSSGGEYRRGTHVRPPAFHPAQDAPHTVGQPGHLQPRTEYPRSPHTRVLPQTPETARRPGLWSATASNTAPKRSPGDPIPNMQVLDVQVPHHAEARDGWDTSPTEQCAASNEFVFMAGDGSLAARAYRLSADQRACLVALAQVSCVEEIFVRFSEAARAAGVNPPLMPWMAKAVESAREWAAKACSRRQETPEVRAILEAMEQGNKGGGRWKQ